MFKNKVFLVIIVLGIIGIMFYSLSGSENYADTVKKQRDTFLKNLTSEDDSPIASLKDFSGIKYFEADKNFIIDAEFKIESAGQGMILMTDSSQTEIKKAGTATFSVNGKTFTVNVFDEGEHFLFPFRDLTSGKETYGGGRFINIPKESLNDDKLEIDFNNAHNFYCAYNESYICPIPPKENFIDAEIRAGEKKYKE
ncbi:DUF1684 domain-containing protein [Emticicia sp. W12TSBA100-4]|uniref:DUF1684 domain-containing protein n=1 Tax=Emticicia sp. W12TSBA100-4 TaxID=3160965 RepID=UPI00330617B7